MTVFIQTNRFGKDPWYSNAATFGIEPTSDTFALIADALRGLRSIWRPGIRYWKAGVMLNDLFPHEQAPGDLFASLSGEVRKVNGYDRRYQWAPRPRHHSPRCFRCHSHLVGSLGLSFTQIHDKDRRNHAGLNGLI